MQSSLVTLLACSTALVCAQQYLPTATYAANLPGASAYSFLPFAGQESEISGRFDFQSQSNGSTEVTFSLSNLPSNLSYPLSYFIAENGVPSDGDCYLTGPVFDPAGALSYCNTAYPQACKVGDLSGKHMNVTSNSTGGDYIDAFIAFSSSAPEYFVNRSIVLMDSNSTRLACTNITSVSVGEGSAPSNITRAPSPVTYANVYNQPESNATTSATASGLSASGSGTTASTGTSTSTTTTGASSMLQALSSSSVLVLALISFLTVC